MTNTKGFVNVGKVGRSRQKMVEVRGKKQRKSIREGKFGTVL